MVAMSMIALCLFFGLLWYGSKPQQWMRIRRTRRNILAMRWWAVAFHTRQEAELRAVVTALAADLLLMSLVEFRRRLGAKHLCRSFQKWDDLEWKRNFQWVRQYINILPWTAAKKCSITTLFKRQFQWRREWPSDYACHQCHILHDFPPAFVAMSTAF